MAPNNGLANRSNGDDEKSGSTTVLKSGTVESRGMGTSTNSRETISNQIKEFLRGEGRCTPKAEVRGFFTVWTFVTRLPGPTWVDHHPGYLMRGMAYFPLSGSLIGVFVSAFYDFANLTLGLPFTIASIISEAASMWITGCFHEDGLADSADGIGGGWSRDQILKIMTDTRLGTYGCAVLLLYMIAKLQLLAILGKSFWAVGACEGGGPAIILTHTLARLTAPLLIKTRDYVDEQGPKYKFYSFFIEAKHLVTFNRVLVAIMTSYFVAYLISGHTKAVALILAVFVASFFSGRNAEYLLGGVMGDYLGATICVTEVYLLTILVLMPHLEHHVGFLNELQVLASGIASGAMSFPELAENVFIDDRKMALLRFVAVGLFTASWCNFVGHPPVFVRKSVIAKKNDDGEVRISLVNNDSEQQRNTGDSRSAVSDFQSALSDPNTTFSQRYDAGRLYIDSLAKPVGSLGTLEDWAARLASLQCIPSPSANIVASIIFVADHGVAKDKSDGGVNCSNYNQAVTRKVVEGLEHGVAGASVLAKSNGASLRVVDIGLAGDNGDTNWSGHTVTSSVHKIIGGTKNFCSSVAMTGEEVDRCILAGRLEVKKCLEGKSRVETFVFGEVGIGNTTTSSALLAALTGKSGDEVCGGGATTTREVVDESILSKKIKIVDEAISFHGKEKMLGNPILCLRNVGGAEIAAIVGAILEASERNIAILVDGFIVSTAALLACQVSPDVSRALLFATKSTEKGQAIAIEYIQAIADDNNIPPPAKPALDMGLRMGEATGGLAAIGVLKSAVTMISQLATLQEVMELPQNNDPIC